jgi:hypothetical protein
LAREIMQPPPARMALKTKKNTHKAVVPAWEE